MLNGKSRVFVGVLVLTGMLLAAGPVSAQDSGSNLDKYLDRYWGEKRDVKIIQKRLFQKDGRISLTPFVGIVPNDDFMLFFPIGLRADYYLSEDLAIELFGSYNINTRTDLAGFLEDAFFIETATPQQLIWNAGLEGLWSPIHGKLGIFTSKLFHFDFHLAFGIGAIGTDVSTKALGGDEEHRVDVAGNVGAGVQMYVSDSAAVRLEYRHFFYAATEEVGGINMPAEITLGFSWFLN